MNKILLLFFYLIFTFDISYCQDILLSEDINIRSAQFYDIVGEVDNRYIVVRDEGSNVVLDIYDSYMNKVKSQEILNDTRNPVIIGSSPSDSTFNLFYYEKYSRDNLIEIVSYNNKGIIVDTLSVKSMTRNNSGYKFVYSESNSKSLLFKLDTKNVGHFMVFDNESCTLNWSCKLKFSSNIKRFFNKAIVNESGKVVLLEKVERGLFEVEQDLYNVNLIHEGNLFISTVGLKNEQDISNIDIEFGLFDNNEVYIYGFGSENTNNNTSVFRFHKPFNDFLQDEFILDIAFTNELYKEYYKTKQNLFINDLYLKYLINKNEGGFILVGEVMTEHLRRNYRRRRMEHYSNLDSEGWVDYTHKDILVLSYNNKNEFEGVNILRKNQQTQDENVIYSSFFMMNNDKNLKFIYNDDLNDSSLISEYIIDISGSAKRNSILNTSMKDIRLRFDKSIQVDYNSLLVPSQIGNILNLVKIEF